MTLKRSITIDLEGEDESDLEEALEEAVNRIKSGNREGWDRNEHSNFKFQVTEYD